MGLVERGKILGLGQSEAELSKLHSEIQDLRTLLNHAPTPLVLPSASTPKPEMQILKALWNRFISPLPPIQSEQGYAVFGTGQGLF